MSIDKLKGTQDYGPEEQIIRQQITNTIKAAFEKYGFSPLETSMLHNLDNLAAKYAGGAEILKEIYKLNDQGDRKLGLRFDLTVPLSLYIGANPTIKMPFKRYEIGKVFRDGPIKKGRLREFWQCDVDVIGIKSVAAEGELLALAKDVFKDLDLDVNIHVNNRKVLNGLMTYAGITKNADSAILSIDKLEKFGKDAVTKELMEKGFDSDSIEKVLHAITLKGKNSEIITALKEKITDAEGLEGIKELEDLLAYLKALGVDVNLDVSLARGLSYYTGTIYEVFLKDKSFSSALAGGGRWDKMIGLFLGGNKDYPAVGISFGLEPINVIMKQKLAVARSVATAYIIPIGTLKESLEIAQELRSHGVKVDIDLMEKGPSKNLQYAHAVGFPYVIFIGDGELKEKKLKLKDMKSGKEDLLTVKECSHKLNSI